MSYFPAPIPQPVTATAGDFAVTAVGIVGVTQATSPWVTTSTISGISTVTGTVFATLAGTSVVAGIVSATQGTSPWIVAGTVSATQGTSPWVVSAAAIGATQSGVWAVNSTVTSIPGVGPTGTTAPTTAIVNGIIVSGTLQAVSSTFPMPVSGALSATQGTSPWVVSAVAVGVTQSTSPWVISGAVSSTQGTVPWSVNATQFAGITLGATAVTNYGSSPAAVIVPGVNAFVTNTVTIANTAVTLAGTAGVVTATIAGNPVVFIKGNAGGIIDAVTTTAAAPANGIAILGQYNTTAPTLTATQSVMIQSNVKGSVLVSTEGAKATYRSTAVASPSLASALFPTVVLPGSSSKVVKITAVHIALSTAAATSCLLIATVSTSAWTGGTSSATNKGPLDIADPAPSAAPIQYSVVATGGGAIATYPIYKNLITSGVTTVLQSGDAAYDEVFGNNSGAKPITLRGPANAFNVFTSVAVNLYCVLEWTEE